MSGQGGDLVKAEAQQLSTTKFPPKGGKTTLLANAQPSLPTSGTLLTQEGTPVSLARGEIFSASLSLPIRAALDAANAGVRNFFPFFINSNGMVTVFTAPTWLAADYDPLFPLLTSPINSSLAVVDNPFDLLTLTPINNVFIIHRLASCAAPDNPLKLTQTLSPYVKFAYGASIAEALFLNHNHAVRSLKPFTFMLCSVPASDLLPISGTIVHFSRLRKAENMNFFNPLIQCRK